MKSKIAIIQQPPVLLDLDASLKRAVDAIHSAASEGARLAVFPEAYLPGYPTWAWRLRPGGDMRLSIEIHARLTENAVNIATDDLEPLRDVARETDMTIVMGMSEIDSQFSGATLFNTVVLIGPDGEILNRHRKLIPTNPERMVWGRGDARGLRVVDTPVGRIGMLICWENYMPLSRYALYAQKMDILVAPTWDCGDRWQASMRHIATEGGCWVVSLATALRGADIPDDFPGREQLFPDPDEWICDGDASIIAPFSAVEAGPLHRSTDILFGEIDTERVKLARRSLDVAGHYSRPDIFSLKVNRRPMPPVSFKDD
ncbi:MAG: carbon-nitrogen hydrolase family protein [Paracoccaceae bacterium]|nr:carbon-nitrogen hydrolase family protein [Paracoccaceae bacterium]